MTGPQSLVAALTSYGYHPRSNRHSNTLCLGILSDLLDSCPALARDAKTGKVVYSLNFNVTVGNSSWNIDLALGPPEGAAVPLLSEPRIKCGRPSTISLAVEAKSVMTEHNKAVRNRQRDLHAYHNYMHAYFSSSIIAGIVVFNVSAEFFSPLRNVTTVCPECGHSFQPMRLTTHVRPKTLVETGINLFRNFLLRSHANESGFDALAAVVVEHQNTQGSKCKLVTRQPAPLVGDPLHYDAFLKRICEHYTQRYRR